MRSWESEIAIAGGSVPDYVIAGFKPETTGMGRVGFAACALLLSVGGAYADQWQTAPGAVVCRNYFALNEAVTSKNDPRWFAETGCRREVGGVPLTIVQRGGTIATQVRLHSDTPETVWMSILDVMGYATIHGKQRGPLPYDDVSRIKMDADFEALRRRLR
jgi:hypothetical protein